MCNGCVLTAYWLHNECILAVRAKSPNLGGGNGLWSIDTFQRHHYWYSILYADCLLDCRFTVYWTVDLLHINYILTAC